jgi:hypothetical protein
MATALAVLALVAAWRGDEEGCRRHAGDALAEAGVRRLGAVAAVASWALGLLELGLGRPEEAINWLGPVVARQGLSHRGVALWAAPELVEAAARAGRPDQGRAALERFGGWARQVGTPWCIAVARRGAAQLAGGDPAGHAEALAQHGSPGSPLAVPPIRRSPLSCSCRARRWSTTFTRFSPSWASRPGSSSLGSSCTRDLLDSGAGTARTCSCVCRGADGEATLQTSSCCER